ncbi:MAG: flagellar biosynthetic protein FliR [Succinivibrionaceae bacterium]|nr:flagellar biosynthetic protein FliR [Succinivibrionaceae bacterium]
MGEGGALLDTLVLDGLSSFLWPLVRISAFFLSMFAISGRGVPMRVRAGLSLAVTLAILPMIGSVSLPYPMLSLEGALTTISQILVGSAVGLMTVFLSQVFVMAGQLVAMQTGLGFASLVDPVSGTNTPVVGQFFTILTTLVFFALDGHLIFVRLLLESFTSIPVGVSSFGPDNLMVFIDLGGLIFEGALSLSMSAICSMLVINFTLGVMTKAAPQLNVFSLGFAITLIAGIAVLSAILPAYMGNFTHDFNAIFESTCRLVGLSCEGPL